MTTPAYDQWPRLQAGFALEVNIESSRFALMSSRARASDIFTRCVVNGQPTIHQVIAFRNEVVVLYLYLILYLYFLIAFSYHLYLRFFLYLWMWTLSTCKLRMVNPVIHNEVTGSVWPDDQWSAIIVRIQWWYKYKKCSDTNEKYEIQIYKYKLITLVYHRRSPSSSLSLSP